MRLEHGNNTTVEDSRFICNGDEVRAGMFIYFPSVFLLDNSDAR